MKPNHSNALRLSPSEIRSQLELSITEEATSMAEMLKLLGEYDDRRLYLNDGFSSLFKYLTEHHNYSESSAVRRSHACRLLRAFPEVFDLVANRDLSLTVLSLIYQSWTNQNLAHGIVSKLIRDLIRKSKTEAEEHIARLSAKLPVARRKKSSLKVIGVTTPEEESTPQGNDIPVDAFGVDSMSDADNKVAASFWSDGDETPTSADVHTKNEATPSLLYKLTMELTEEQLAKLKRVQEITGRTDFAEAIEFLSEFYLGKKDPIAQRPAKSCAEAIPVNHAEPKSAQIFTVTMNVKCNKTKQVDSHMNQSNQTQVQPKLKSTTKSQKSQSLPSTSPSSRYIPKQTRDSIFQKFNGQCSYVSKETGLRCSERRHLEVDHIHPFARQGSHQQSNLQLLCKSHNLLRARECFGSEFVAAQIDACKAKTN